MHQLFVTPELLEIIFRSGDKRESAICARVCKLWSGVALNVLWRDLDGLYGLFSLLGEILQQPVDSRHDFRSWPTLATWRRLSFYAPRVRTLVYDETRPETRKMDLDCFDLVAMTSVVSILLPNLRSFTFLSTEPDNRVAHIMFMHETIRQFDLLLSPTYHPPSLFQNIVERMPFLTHLRLRSNMRIGSFHEPLCSLIKGLPQLVSVTLPTLFTTSAVIEELSHLNHLESLEIDKEPASWDEHFDLTPVPSLTESDFPKLTSLSLSIHLSHLKQVFEQGFSQPCLLTNIYVQEVMGADDESVFSFLGALVKHCPLLTDLTLSLRIPMEWLFVAAVSYAGLHTPITSDALYPLLPLKNLRTLEIHHPKPLDISDQDVEFFTAHWPNLETISLNPDPDLSVIDTPSQITLASLLSLHRNCPKIRTISLLLSPPSIPILTLDTPLHPFRHLEKFHVGQSDIIKIGSVAAFLSQLFPPECIITVGGESSSELQLIGRRSATETAIRLKRWKDVQDVLPHFIRMVEERRALESKLQTLKADLEAQGGATNAIFANDPTSQNSDGRVTS
ncbi:hypothetical protein JAAARDRAFT_328881 [Jaapia argillacea MUCL 33604]|uniref:F-box domain-containing protein n=1 Tax=Jaapia argillacea MUCL 33604 TaxID=933084 RepID=A0A067PLP9_9AGAM|nr:hypothetical protein JAAARDRAFT_328881 [Jaapia argillacea MUCL 33604]